MSLHFITKSLWRGFRGRFSQYINLNPCWSHPAGRQAWWAANCSLKNDLFRKLTKISPNISHSGNVENTRVLSVNTSDYKRKMRLMRWVPYQVTHFWHHHKYSRKTQQIKQFPDSTNDGKVIFQKIGKDILSDHNEIITETWVRKTV